MKILIDAMGGDNAPLEIVKGAMDASAEFGVEIALVGKEKLIKDALSQIGAAGMSGVEIINAEELVEMHDDPATATRKKKDSSMTVCLQRVREEGYDATISAGSTGALLTGATLITKRIRGIRRAALAPVIPAKNGGVMLIDVGASADCTPEYLLQFAYMGSFYMQAVHGIKSPRVGLLNIGAEETKGTGLQKDTFAMLTDAAKAGRINFSGNVEASGVMEPLADVVVSDGFSGNTLLKAIEGTAQFMTGEIKKLFMTSAKTKLAALLVKSDIAAFKRRLDVSEVGGTALLGISRPVIKAHGSSNARAIRSAVKQAMVFVEGGVIEKITENIDNMRLDKIEYTE